MADHSEHKETASQDTIPEPRKEAVSDASEKLKDIMRGMDRGEASSGTENDEEPRKRRTLTPKVLTARPKRAKQPNVTDDQA